MKHKFIPISIGFLFVLGLMSCNGGGTAPSPSAGAGDLKTYIAMLDYTPLDSTPLQTNLKTVQTAASADYELSFTTAESVTLSQITLSFYANNNCSGGNPQNINIQGAATLLAGTYTTTDLSNYSVCSTLYPGGCQQLFQNKSSIAKSMQFTYVFTNNSNVKSTCLYNPELKYETFANYDESTQPKACSSSINCSLSESYPDVIFPITIAESWQNMNYGEQSAVSLRYITLDTGGNLVIGANNYGSDYCGPSVRGTNCGGVFTSAPGGPGIYNSLAWTDEPLGTIAAGAPNTIFMGTQPNASGGTYYAYTMGQSQPTILYDFYLAVPTASYFSTNSNSQNVIFYADNIGDLFANGTQTFSGPLDPIHQYTTNQLTQDVYGNIWMATDLFLDTNHGGQLFKCSFTQSTWGSNCSLLDSGSAANTSVTADFQGNVYSAWSDNKVIIYPDGNQPSLLLYPTIYNQATNGSGNTQVAWDEYHQQLIVAVAGSNQLLTMKPDGSLTAQQLPPVLGQSSSPSQIVVNNQNGTVYILYTGGNGTIYSIQYPN